MHTIEFPLWQMTYLIWFLCLHSVCSIQPQFACNPFLQQTLFLYITYIEGLYSTCDFQNSIKSLEADDSKNLKYSQEIQVQENADIFNVNIFKMKRNPSINLHKYAVSFLSSAVRELCQLQFRIVCTINWSFGSFQQVVTA